MTLEMFFGGVVILTMVAVIIISMTSARAGSRAKPQNRR